MNSTAKFLNESQVGFLRTAAKRKLLNFCQVIDQKYEAAWFHEVIADCLEKALTNTKEGKKTRIILSIPPRHGKSQLASIYFPAWALGKHPTLKFILSTYGAELSEEIGMKTRDVIRSPEYGAIFPEIELRQDTKAKAKWQTNKGGSFTAVGVGGAVTGRGADIIICDDLHKDRAEAESETVRSKVWDYYRSTLYSRLEGFGAVIVIMQRWHTDDLVGKLLDEQERLKLAGEAYDDWEVINFPAIADDDEFYEDKLVRSKGQSLWEKKFPIPVLDNIRQVAGVYGWASQYQQDPVLSETQEFKTDYFKYITEDELQYKYLRYYTLVDPAISQKKEADNTVVLTVGKEVNGPNIYRIREDAGKFTPQQTIDLIFKHQEDFKGSRMFLETVAYQKALKYSIEEEQRRRGVYFSVNELKADNKESRIRGLLPLYQAGVIYHRKSDVEYERELLQFPRGKHDDRADAMSYILSALHNTENSSVSQFKQKLNGYFRSK